MSNGRAHDRFGLFLGATLTGLLWGVTQDWVSALSLSLGGMVGVLVLSPDLDLGPKKRVGIVRVVLYPYSMMFKHRGLSHHFILGTISRLLFLYVLVILFLYWGRGRIVAEFSWKEFFSVQWNFGKGYDYGKWHYRSITWFVIGLFCADMSHYILDWFSSLKIIRWIKK